MKKAKRAKKATAGERISAQVFGYPAVRLRVAPRDDVGVILARRIDALARRAFRDGMTAGYNGEGDVYPKDKGLSRKLIEKYLGRTTNAR